MGRTWSDENLPQKVDYEMGDHIISGRQKKWKKIVEWIITVLGWMVMLSYLIYIIYGMFAVKFGWYLPQIGIYTPEMIEETRGYFYTLFIATLIVTLLLILWKNYNLQRFGKLHRRKFRPPVDNSELVALFEVDEALLTRMQNEKCVVLEHNIIPEGLGMRYQKPEKKEKQES